MTVDQNSVFESLREGSRENETIFLLAEVHIGRNNIKGFKYCSEFSDCTIGWEYRRFGINAV